jgi:2-C-methyl-D-erythritol 4-phosphate cytidylyltransferase
MTLFPYTTLFRSEKLGLTPLIVQSAERNIKITNSKDLQLAEFFLGKQS